MKSDDREFIKGLACAAALSVRVTFDSSVGRDVISEAGYTKADLINAKVEQYDIDIIYPADKPVGGGS